MGTSNLPRSAIAGVVCAVVLSACGGGGNDEAAAPSSPSPAKSADASGSPSPAAEQPEVAPTDLANFSCDRQDNGQWKATGDITNSADKAMVYTVTVVTTDAGDKVLGERAKSFKLAPEESTNFAWGKFFRGAAERCMPHLERKPA